MIATADKLGLGVYSIHDAALYMRVPAQTISRWVYGTTRSERTVTPKFADNERVISFLDFIQALAIRTVRTTYNVPLAKIREAIQRATKDYGYAYPLARQRTMYVYGKDLYILREDSEFSKLTGKNREQQYFRKVVELYMKDISFDPSSDYATAYEVHKYHVNSDARTISMDPEYRFGEPLVRNCSYSARALWEAVNAEGGIDEAASAYGIDAADVEAAYRYYDSLLIRHVA